MTSPLDSSRVAALRQQIETDRLLQTAAPTQKTRLVANMLIARDMRQMLMVPDYAPPFVSIIRGLFGDCNHVPALDAENPIVCNACRKQIGTVRGLASGVNTLHADCQFNFREPPWFKTEGFHRVAGIMFPNNRNASAILAHYIITEYLANEQRKATQYAASSSADGFEHIGTLSC